MPAKFFFFCTLYVMCWCNGSKSPRATMCEMPCSSSNGSENPAEQLPRNRPGMISWIGLLAVFILHFWQRRLRSAKRLSAFLYLKLIFRIKHPHPLGTFEHFLQFIVKIIHELYITTRINWQLLGH